MANMELAGALCSKVTAKAILVRWGTKENWIPLCAVVQIPSTWRINHAKDRAGTTLIVADWVVKSKWQIDAPTEQENDAGPWLSPDLSIADISKYFDNAVRQLGGTTSPLAVQVVYVSYNAAADCRGCTPFTFEHVASHDDEIQILPHIMTLTAEALEHAITHGLGHVLGYEDHLPPGRKGVMMPIYDYVPQPRSQYTADDLAAIATGRVVGGVFR